jgi:tetrahydromethanopterin S-methyltransferase subunit B
MDETEHQDRRETLHRLSDRIQSHDNSLAEQRMALASLDGRVAAIGDSMVTKDGLALNINRIEGKIDRLTDVVDPIRRGIYWTIGLIVGSVILAMLALILKR